MEKENNNNQFIVCPVCGGGGKKKNGFACPNCGGMGLGVFQSGRFYYWGLNLGNTVINLNYARRRFRQTINFISFIAGLIGFFCLAYWLRLAYEADSADLASYFFWRQKHWLLLIFWLSAIADMFVYYRLSEDEAFKNKIRKVKFGEIKKISSLPNNWDELKKEKSIIIDASKGLSAKAMKTLEQAYLLADKSGHAKASAAHLFFALMNDAKAAAVFSRVGADFKKLAEKIKKRLLLSESGGGRAELSNEIKEILINAYVGAGDMGKKKVEAVDFILPCMDADKELSEILYDMEIDRDKVNNVIQWFAINEKLVENYRCYRRAARYKPSSTMDKAYTAVASPSLNRFARDLTVASKWGRLEICVGRDKEIENIFQAMESGRSGIILVGPDGVGKRAVINGIARRMVEEDVPEIIKDKRLVELDVARLLSGADPAQAEERLLMIVDETARAGNIILFIDNIENIAGITAGAEESLELAEVLAAALERKNFFCLASAESMNYAKYIENSALGKGLAKIEINEPAGNQAIQIIESKIGNLEGKYKIYFSYDAIESAVNYAVKYIHDKYLPGKAVDILESIAVSVARTRGENALAGKEDAARIVSEITHIPVMKVTEKESQTLLNLEERIHERMINQVEAVKMVAASLRRARAELREGKRPIANFLFLGPTGVGKTELAKTVSEVYFGKEEYMIRLDMSEYQNRDSVNKMIGDQSGARGYLTEAVRRSPFALILLDEFEKAHPDILNLFLQVMDDGRLTDGQGKTIDFTNSIIIATSNAGALFIQKEIMAGADMEMVKSALINEYLNKVIRPELINRFDGVIVFKPLTMENVVDIAGLMLGQIGKMLEVKGIKLRTDAQGVRKLAEAGFDPKFGARPLRRLLHEKINDNIANMILAGELKRRDTVVIGANTEIQVEKRKEL